MMAAFTLGAVPGTVADVEAKTKTQKKNENKAKAYKAARIAKKK
jgi:hypothetical protein